MKKTLFTLFFLSLTLYAKNINIAVAANVSYAIPELISAFHQQNPDIKVQTTLGSSGKLTAQIQNGAPYDILLSANMKYPQALYKKALALTKPLVYAQGSLAILSTQKRDFHQGINIVTNKDIKRIAIANPNTAPYGKASRQALQNAGLYTAVKSKLIYAESASQTVAFTITAADLGFVAKSTLFSPKMKQYKEGIHYTDVNPKLYTPIKQGIVLLKHATNNAEAEAFYKFILSKNAKNIFKKYGYQVQ
ncbi:molybdate ABC transporter substrate-binding protein [Sulfurimonas sp.]